MSEQLWYTWSTSGFGISSAGFRVRAASKGFLDARGQVDMQSERLLTLMKSLNYDLPQDTLNPYDVDPQQAPRGLAFVQAGQERVLINKTYTGLDSVKRAGNFFSHLLTDLPPVPSPCPGGQLPFSAREAIKLWGSNFWKDSERSLDPRSLDLPQVTSNDLPRGPLSGGDVTKGELREQLLYVLHAFLTLPTLGGQKRLFIAAPPDTVAALIWGLTHALPRTLTVMRHLTFSTYERDIDKSSAMIVGTCWLSPLAQDGRGNTPRDLPASYYQEQNLHGLAINCYLPDHKTPVKVDPRVINFVQFAIKCFVQNNMSDLQALLDEAEKRNISEVSQFLQFYTAFQETSPREEVMRILAALIARAEALIEGAINILREGKVPSSAALLVSEENVRLEADIKRENVRRSIMLLITKNPQWWREQGQATIGKLVQLADRYSTQDLTALQASFIQKVTTSKEWQKDQGQTVIGQLGLAGQGAGENSVTMLTAFVERMVSIVNNVQNELATALLPLTTNFGDQLREAIQANDLSQTSFWADVLATSTSVRSETEVWVSLLRNLWQARYTAAYRQWWATQGKDATQQVRLLAEREPQSELARQLSAFAIEVANVLCEAIVAQGMATKLDKRSVFLLDVFTVTAPASESGAWPYLLQKLSMSPSAHLHVSELFSWELRSLLLQTWGSIAVLRDNPFILRDWLKVRWQELDSLLLLKLPEDWYKVAITQLLSAPFDIALQEVMDLVTAHAALFEEVLQLLMKIPTGQQGALATRQEALRFFATLAEQGYPRRTQLLDGMLKASGYQQEVTEALFASVHLDSPEEVAELLEHHCKESLEGYELPPTLLSFIRQYLANFDVNYLDTDPTRELLQRLWQRRETPALRLPPELQATLEGWYRIAEFIAQPNVSKNWLRDLNHTIRNMTQLTPDTRSKLATKLVPRLVEFASTEVDLARVIDNLGRALMRPGTGVIEPDLLLLVRMAKIAGEKYGRERPPVRIAPYIKVVLAETRYLPSAEKEQFVDRCFQALLKDMDAKTRDQLRVDALWPDDFLVEWKAYTSRPASADVKAALTRFREALERKEMFRIVEAYHPSLERFLTPDEKGRLALAHTFVEAYQADRDDAIVAAHEAIRKSPYSQLLGYTQQQRDRTKLAHSRVSSPSSPAPVRTPVQAPAAKAQPPAQPPSASQATLMANRTFVAAVQGQGITLGWLEWVLMLKKPYTQYRLSALRQRIQQLEQSDQRDHTIKQELKFKKGEVKELEKLSADPQQLRQVVLEDLVDDVLIQQGIAQLIERDPAQRKKLDPEPDLDAILTALRMHQGDKHPQLRSDDSSIVEDIRKVLQIFRRRELFAWYLHDEGQKALYDWLRERRRGADISIDYERAGVKPPGKPLNFTRLSFR